MMAMFVVGNAVVAYKLDDLTATTPATYLY